MKKFRFLKYFILLACILLCAMLTACNSGDNGTSLPCEHFEANCTQKGFTRYYMPNGTYFDREDNDGSLGDHMYEIDEIISAKTCTQDGIVKKKCKFCGDVITEVEQHSGHDFKKTAIEAVSCTKDGLYLYECKKCDYSSVETVPKIPHALVEKERKEPTCTEDGYSYNKCLNCDYELRTVLDKLHHAYISKVVSEPTCTREGLRKLKCDVCGHEEEEIIPKLNHNFNITITKEATCTQKGEQFAVCHDCGYSETQEIDIIAHTQKGEVLHDADGHWKICDVCGEVFDYQTHDIGCSGVPSTCIEHAYSIFRCHFCDYSYTVTDENSELAPHSYTAYTCHVCSRDEMLDYKKIFDSKGAGERNLIEINSPKMMTLFYDFVLFYEITTPKYFKVTYRHLTKDDSREFFNEVRRSSTATNWAVDWHTYASTLTGEISHFTIAAINENNFRYDKAATVAPTEYDAKTHVEYESYQFSDVKNARPSNFDSFKYQSRLNAISVTSSDQLFYAFEHGYKPIPIAGSAAEKMLNKAKSVAIRIIDDNASDLEKVRAIYSYLVSEVAYDYGVVAMTDIAFAEYASYYLEGVFDYGVAVCDGISKAFCVLAGIEDIKCVRVISANHAWNRVFINEESSGISAWFNSDATWGNQSVKYGEEYGEYFALDDFLFTDERKVESGQESTNYKQADADAITEINPFKLFDFYDEEGCKNDFYISTDEELELLIKYLESDFNRFNKGDKVTIQILVASSYCKQSEIAETFHSAFLRLWAMASYASYSVSNELVEYGLETGYVTTIIIPKFNG